MIKNIKVLIPNETKLMYVNKFEVPFEKYEDLNCKICDKVLPVIKNRGVDYYSIRSCSCQKKKGNKNYMLSVFGNTDLFIKTWSSIIDARPKGPLKDILINKYGQEEGLKRYDHFLAGCNVSLKGFVGRLGKEEGLRRYEDFKKKSLITKEAMINRHGEEEGLKRYRVMQDKMRAHGKFGFNYWLNFFNGDYDTASEAYRRFQSRDLFYFVSKYGEIEGEKRYEALCNTRKNQNSIEYRIKTHGKSGVAMWDKECKQKSVTLNRFIGKYGEEKGTIKWVALCDTRAQTLENMVLKYGKDIGTLKYVSYRKALLSHLKTEHRRSKFQVELFVDVFKYGELNPKDFLYDAEELLLFDEETGSACFYDFCCPKDKKIIEFFGDFWHANPSLYDESYYNKMTKKTAKEMWEKDRKRIDKAKSMGYEVLVIWEKDVRFNRFPEIQKCISFIKG